MTTSMMNIGRPPRRRRKADVSTPLEKATALALVATLAATAVLVLVDSRAATVDRAGTESSASSSPTIEASAPTASAAGTASAQSEPSTFVESAGAAESVPVEIGGYTVFAESPSLVVTVGPEAVNMRSEPGIGAGIVGQVAPGDAVMASMTGTAATNGDEIWWEVLYADTVGWVRADLVVRADAN